MELSHGQYLISDDPARLDATAIHAYLSRCYWSENIPLETVRRALANSLCIGAYIAAKSGIGQSSVASAKEEAHDASGAQIGLARFISDFATFCYVCDVYVLEGHRGHGLAKAMMEMSVRHPKLQGLRRWNLVTRDAHGLYAPLGFTPIRHPERYMEKLDPGVYQRSAQHEAR